MAVRHHPNLSDLLSSLLFPYTLKSEVSVQIVMI